MRTDRTTYLSEDELMLTLHVVEPTGATLAILIDGTEVPYTGQFKEHCEVTVDLSGLKERMHQLKAVIRTGTGDEVSAATSNFNVISPYLSLNAAPSVVNVSASSYRINKGTEVDFHADFEDIDGDDVAVTWDFGDGSTGSGSDVTHSFDKAGTYTVTVTGSDGSHATTERITIVVEGEGKGSNLLAIIVIASILLLLMIILGAILMVVMTKRRSRTLEE